MEGMVSMDDYLRIQEQLKQKIKSLEAALKINNSLVKLMDSENKTLKEQLRYPSKIIINSDLTKSIEKTLSQLLIDIPLKDMSKKEIKEVLAEILVVIREDNKTRWIFGLDLSLVE